MWKFLSIWHIKEIKNNDKIGCPAVDVWPGQSLPRENGAIEKEEKKHKKGLWEREAEEQGQAGSGEKQNNPHGTQAKREREENKIVQFGGAGREQQ